MSNVLSNLFEEIANAIREKTGGTDTMKPAEFPAEIASIMTGGGSSGGELKYTIKHFTPSSDVTTVSHNLGYVPDITIVIPGEVPLDKQISFGIGLSSAMLEAVGGGWLNIIQGASTNGTQQLTADIGVEADAPGFYYADWGGGIRSMTSTSFVIGGGSMLKLATGKSYSYITIGGITG